MTFGDPSEALLRGRVDSENSEEYLMCATGQLQKNGEMTVKLGGLGALQGATVATDKANGATQCCRRCPCYRRPGRIDDLPTWFG